MPKPEPRRSFDPKWQSDRIAAEAKHTAERERRERVEAIQKEAAYAMKGNFRPGYDTGELTASEVASDAESLIERLLRRVISLEYAMRAAGIPFEEDV